MKILMGVPSSGTISEGSAQASWLVSLHHEVDRIPSCASGPNFNRVWCNALNQKKYTHLAMIHADLTVLEEEENMRWGDILVEELEAHDADFISVPMAIKDMRGVTSCGIGDEEAGWFPYRRFCTNEFPKFPKTFTAADTGHPGKFLLHNHALCMWDMRKPLWRVPNEDGTCRFTFNFTERIILNDDVWITQQDSEDWAFSRDLWKAGAKTLITSRIKTHHHGSMNFANYGDSGTYKNGDEDTAEFWRKLVAV